MHGIFMCEDHLERKRIPVGEGMIENRGTKAPSLFPTFICLRCNAVTVLSPLVLSASATAREIRLVPQVFRLNPSKEP